MLYVPLPTPDDRVAILRAISHNVKLAADVDLEKIGRNHRAEGYSGADCAALLREAGLAVLKEEAGRKDGGADPSSLCITLRHFHYAFDHVTPSVSRRDQARYDRMRDRMAHARSRGGVIEAPKDQLQGEIEEEIEEIELGTQDAPTVDAVMLGDASQQSDPSQEEEEEPVDDECIPVMNGTSLPPAPTSIAVGTTRNDGGDSGEVSNGSALEANTTTNLAMEAAPTLPSNSVMESGEKDEEGNVETKPSEVVASEESTSKCV